MKIVTILLFLTSFSIISNELDGYGETCLTNGDCQALNQLKQGERCYLFINDDYTCSKKCYIVSVGSYCKKPKGYEIGFCRKESVNRGQELDPRDQGWCSSVGIEPF